MIPQMVARLSRVREREKKSYLNSSGISRKIWGKKVGQKCQGPLQSFERKERKRERNDLFMVPSRLAKLSALSPPLLLLLPAHTHTHKASGSGEKVWQEEADLFASMQMNLNGNDFIFFLSKRSCKKSCRRRSTKVELIAGFYPLTCTYYVVCAMNEGLPWKNEGEGVGLQYQHTVENLERVSVPDKGMAATTLPIAKKNKGLEEEGGATPFAIETKWIIDRGGRGEGGKMHVIFIFCQSSGGNLIVRHLSITARSNSKLFPLP